MDLPLAGYDPLAPRFPDRGPAARLRLPVLLGVALVVLLRVEPAAPGRLAAAALLLTAAVVVQARWLGGHQDRGRVRTAALLVQTVLVYAPVPWYEDAWLGLGGFLAGSLLLTLCAAAAWPLFGVVTALAALLAATPVTGPTGGTAAAWQQAGLALVITAVIGLAVYGLARLTHVLMSTREVRREITMLAVTQERLRFARDLHDLLGYSLSAITLKSELTRRLLARSPAQAEAELDEILRISRQALADVRAVANGYSELSLEEEAESARAVLLAADVHVDLRLHHRRELSRPVGTVLATVLREGVTNVLRHSRAGWCEISVHADDGRVWLRIVNDGVGCLPGATEHAGDDGPGGTGERDEGGRGSGGSGLENLAARVEQLGGWLRSGRAGERFELTASVPLTTPGAEGPVERVVEPREAADRLTASRRTGRS
ncbi:MAG TPA: histidine kinase [Pseudonocardiaceae bacterium]